MASARPAAKPENKNNSWPRLLRNDFSMFYT